MSRAVQLVAAFVLLTLIYLLAGRAGYLNSGIALIPIPFAVVLFSMVVLVIRLRWAAVENWEIALASLTLTIVWFSFVLMFGGMFLAFFTTGP